LKPALQYSSRAKLSVVTKVVIVPSDADNASMQMLRGRVEAQLNEIARRDSRGMRAHEGRHG